LNPSRLSSTLVFKFKSILPAIIVSSIMPPSVLGIGLPATSDIVPWLARGALQKALDAMEADMTASPYEWEMLYITPDTSFDVCTAKFHERKWDVVMVGSRFYL
jgi:hypothetical protein